jgi:hypothetical protein
MNDNNPFSDNDDRAGALVVWVYTAMVLLVGIALGLLTALVF